MQDSNTRIQTMRDMFLYAQKLYSWQVDGSFELTYSNCPSQDFFFNLLCLSACRQAAQDHFRTSKMPIQLSDSMGFAWIAATDGESIHFLGPIFTLDASESYLRKQCSRMKLSSSLVNQLLEQIKLVPMVNYLAVARFAIMLHYCVTGEPIAEGEVATYYEPGDIPEVQEWYSTTWHGTRQAELEMCRRVREGCGDSPEDIGALFSGGQVGDLSPGDPLRQAKNMSLCFTVLVSRAAMEGGMSPEGAYSLSDYYVQRSEVCTRITDVHSCSMEMYKAFVSRVHKCKETEHYSAAVSAAMEYTRTHIAEKISLEEMAGKLGYTSYYLSSKFQKETGTSLNNHIKQEKVELAKKLLSEGRLPASEISERLSFSSPSYFSATFKQCTGMTPSEYQNRKDKHHE